MLPKVASSIMDRILGALRPEQICWLCLLATIAGGTFAMRTFASTGDVESLQLRVLSMQIFDYRVRQCQALDAGQSGQLYAKLLEEPMARYAWTNGSMAYRLPDCKEL